MGWGCGSPGGGGTSSIASCDVILLQVRDDEEMKNVMEETFKTPEIQSRDIGAAQQKVASIFISQSQKVQVCDAHSSEYNSFSRKEEIGHEGISTLLCTKGEFTHCVFQAVIQKRYLIVQRCANGDNVNNRWDGSATHCVH